MALPKEELRHKLDATSEVCKSMWISRRIPTEQYQGSMAKSLGRIR
jgi:hypothetical protein